MIGVPKRSAVLVAGITSHAAHARAGTRLSDELSSLPNQVTYSVGKKTSVRIVPTNNPPMIAKAIGPQNTVGAIGIIVLGLALGAGMTQWPYTHGCGVPLFAYLGGVGAVLVAATWSTVSSWRTRSAVAHFLSLALFVWGGFLAAREVLPRIGYAKQTAGWTCRTPAAPAQNDGAILTGVLGDLAHRYFQRLANNADANLGIIVVHLQAFQGFHGVDQGNPTTRHDTVFDGGTGCG